MFELIPYVPKSIWNKGKLVGQKLPLKLEEIWAIRIRLQLSNNLRGLAMFNLALDSKLRACDLIKLKVRDIAHGSAIPLGFAQQRSHLPIGKALYAIIIAKGTHCAKLLQ